MDEWLPWLVELEERRPDVAVYELPVLASMYSPARWFIDGGMARGGGNDRTITVYTYVAKAGRELGLPGTDTIGVLLVDRGAASSPANKAASTTRVRRGSPRRASARTTTPERPAG